MPDEELGSACAGILAEVPLISRMKSGRVQDKVRRLEEQMESMNSKIDAMAETFESRRADDEAAAIAAERIRSGAADHKEDGAEALAKLGIELPKG
jgi:outer membrane murein-binding lipoprotein Lpp